MNKKAVIILLITIMAFAFIGCSTKKNTPVTRFYHAMTARFNIYYNGEVAYKDGIKALDDANKDFYLEKLPMYEIGNKNSVGSGSSNFDIAIEKSQKAIKLHSIKKKPKRNPKKLKDPKYKLWLSRKEFNPFLHNAWMLMGKAQFQKGEFIEAASTFSYIARLYAAEPEVQAKAKLWLAECYSQLDWFYDAEDILNKLNNDSLPQSSETKYAAAMANMMVRQGRFEEAIPYLSTTIKKERKKLYKARYYYLMGQLKQHTGDNTGAYRAYSKCAKLNAKYDLALAAKIRMTEVIPKKEIPKVLKRMNRMAKQGKNKQFSEQIYYAIGNIHLSLNDTLKAIESYKKGAENENTSTEKGVLLLRLGDLYWSQNEYKKAQEAYKNALGMLTNDYEGYEELNKRSTILDEFVEYAEAVELQDSLQHLAKLPKEEQLEIINKIIEEVKREEEEMRKEEERQKLMAEREENMGEFNMGNNNTTTTPTIANGDKSWYFYNTQLVTQGKAEFTKKWGRRKLEDDWRRRNKTIINMDDEMGYNYDEELVDSLGNPIEMNDSTMMADTAVIDNKNPEYYLQQLPVTEEQIAESNDIIKDGLFNMGIIYKNKLEDFPNALKTFERLYTQYPDYPDLDEVFYNLYLMCMLWNREDLALKYKQMLIDTYPESQYAMVLSDPDYLFNIKYGKHLEDSLYADTYEAFKDGNMMKVKENYDISTTKYAMGAHRAKFIFMYAMSELYNGNQTKFLELLKEVVTKYPDNEITSIAESIIKGAQDGKILQGAMLGSIWSRRNLEAQSELGDSAKIEQFSDDRDLPHLFILAFEEGKVDENLLLYTMAKYNFSSFVIKNFDLSFETVNGIRMLKTSIFTNYIEANQYIKLLYSNKEMAQKLSGIKAIIISEHNFDLLSKYYSFEDYEEFFRQTYSDIPELNIEGIIFDTPDYESLEEDGFYDDQEYSDGEEVFLD